MALFGSEDGVEVQDLQEELISNLNCTVALGKSA